MAIMKVGAHKVLGRRAITRLIQLLEAKINAGVAEHWHKDALYGLYELRTLVRVGKCYPRFTSYDRFIRHVITGE